MIDSAESGRIPKQDAAAKLAAQSTRFDLRYAVLARRVPAQ